MSNIFPIVAKLGQFICAECGNKLLIQISSKERCLIDEAKHTENMIRHCCADGKHSMVSFQNFISTEEK